MINFIWNKMMLKRKKVVYGKNLKIYGRIHIHGEKNHIIIGDNNVIISSSDLNPTSGFNNTHLRTENGGMIVIGNNVGMSHVNITSFCSVTIEDNVLLGSGVKIWDTDFHSVIYENRMKYPAPDVKSKPIYIAEGAFIGACSIILKGVTIGERAVIGAGSVVTKNVPADEVWAGNPAKQIRKLEKVQNG